MAAQTFSYSAFLRGPSEVLPALDNADVILERRDEENLVLMRVGRARAALDGLRVAARSLSLVAWRYPELAEEVLAEELPWLHWLPENEQVQCVRQLLADLRAGAETGEFLPFARNLIAWRSTAEVWSDPELAHDLQGPFPGAGAEIPRPHH